MSTQDDVMDHLMNSQVGVQDAADLPEQEIVTGDEMVAAGMNKMEQYSYQQNGQVGPIHPSSNDNPATITRAQNQMQNSERKEVEMTQENNRLDTMEANMNRMMGMMEQMSGNTQPYPEAPISKAPAPSLPAVIQADPEFLSDLKEQNPTQPFVPQNPLQAVLPVSKKPEKLSVTTLPDGRKIVNRPKSKAPMSVGADINQPTLEEMPLIEQPNDVEANEFFEPEPAIIPPMQNDPNTMKLQHLVSEVSAFLMKKDCHKAFRKQLGMLNRHLSFAGWSPDLKTEFNERYAAMTTDSTFITSICKKILEMDMGHAVAPSNAAVLVMVTAGYLTFGMSGL